MEKDCRRFSAGDPCRRVREETGEERARLKCEGATNGDDWLTGEKRNQEGDR